MDLDALTSRIIGAAIEVHKAIGPGLLESAYEACLARELELQGLKVQRQVPVAIHYKGVRLDVGYRLDLLVADQVIVELKAVEQITAIMETQLLSHLRLTNRQVGLIINFHVPRLRDGIKRMVNNYHP